MWCTALEAPSNGGTSRIQDPDRMPPVTGGIRRDACRDLFVQWLEDNAHHAGAGFVRKLLEQT